MDADESASTAHILHESGLRGIIEAVTGRAEEHHGLVLIESAEGCEILGVIDRDAKVFSPGLQTGLRDVVLIQRRIES